MKCFAVLGLGFGDEGKGMFTDHLSGKLDNPIVVRFSGGQQAGHTVYRDENISHVFSNFGSGTFRGIPTFWSRYCTIDPVGMLNELYRLNEKGVNPVLYVDHRCPVTTPFEIHHNKRLEEKNRHGSCGVGVGATWEREEKHYSLLFEDLFFPSVTKIKLNQIRKHYVDDVFLDDFFEAASIITDHRDIQPASESMLTNFDTVIFEGSQGLLLDQEYGFFPHVTRSNTGTTNILAMGYEPYVYLITRAYQTRHGNGPMTNESLACSIKNNSREKNEEPSYQGTFRKTILDLDLMRYAIQKDKYIRETAKKTLIVTCLDLVDDDFRYTHDGNLHHCNTEQQFISELKAHLGIHEALGFRSPIPKIKGV